MNRLFFLLLVLLILHPAITRAEDFLGAPLIPNGKVYLKNETRLEMYSPLPHDETLVFYKNALEGHRDIKFRDWKDATLIEDNGNLPWHSITISKDGEKGNAIVILKDNWTWILGTLILRYIGV
ncbi:MAG: hypothetical protein SV375_15535, partial [Thermodesulfobacteriota bacterium]|nr:hypothetical protein [Thermodesulfobacteriota bacterium]